MEVTLVRYYAYGQEKVCHASKTAAEAEKKRLRRRDPREYNHSLHTYLCGECVAWHCGSRRSRYRYGRGPA